MRVIHFENQFVSLNGLNLNSDQIKSSLNLNLDHIKSGFSLDSDHIKSGLNFNSNCIKSGLNLEIPNSLPTQKSSKS